MVKQVFQDEKGENNSKNMYEKIVALADVRQLTDFVNPGETFIISNKQAKEV